MNKIIAAIDGSAYADNVCNLSAWASKRLEGADISLLHVVAPHSDVEAKSDFTGSIGLGAKSDLLKQLTELDEAHGKMELKKGQLMLEHAEEELANKHNISSVEVLHRRGSLVETLNELESQSSLIVMGKRGEQADTASDHLGSNLERVARSIHTPILISTKDSTPITRFLIAYDGGTSADKALDYVVNNPLLKGLECHLLTVGGEKKETCLEHAQTTLEKAGFDVHSTLQKGKSVDDLVAAYLTEHDIHLLVIGAYGHSKIHNLILGSTTTALLHRSHIPLLLFK